jgi:hypothetical protein
LMQGIIPVNPVTPLKDRSNSQNCRIARGDFDYS